MEIALFKLREMVVQLLYAFELGGQEESEIMALLMQELAIAKRHVLVAYQRAEQIWRSRECLDQAIGCSSENYAFERIKLVEKSILRVAFYELLVEKELNLKIILSEANRLARKFSTPEAATFIHALLVHNNSNSLLDSCDFPSLIRENAL